MVAVLIYLGLGVAALVLLLLFFQEKLMYFPSAYTEADLTKATAGGLERLEYTTAEGRQVAFYQPAPGAGPPAQLWFVYCGNGSRVLDLSFLFENLPDHASRAVLYLDYPGYGACEGRPSPESSLASGRAGLKALWEAKGWPGKAGEGSEFHFLGHSLGSAGTLQLAASLGRADSVVLLCPFTSMRDMANARVSPALSWLLHHNFDNRASLGALLAAAPDARVTLVHGTMDTAIPVSMSRQLAAGHPGKVTLIELPKADHNDFVWDELPLIQGLILGQAARGR
jgi:pimeloyl-ACP methyl ester carboxylesterase